MVMLLVMQSRDNAIALLSGDVGSGAATASPPSRIATSQARRTFEIGNQAAQWLARYTGGVAQSNVLEALCNIPTTAHILGGAAIGADHW